MNSYEKAYAQLLRFLSEDQKVELANTNRVTEVSKTGKRYRVDYQRAHLVDENECILRSLCAYPPSVPAPEKFLAKLLAIRFNEKYLWDTAYHTPGNAAYLASCHVNMKSRYVID
jgi:hypothetical protein